MPIGLVSVDDDGRGIPFGLHPEEGVSVVEIVFTRLHAGGKFDKGAGGAYSFSGGLHGVGVSVTNALAKRLDVTVWRGGQVASIGFAGGAAQPLAVKKAGPGEWKSGTTIRVWPDPRYFEKRRAAAGRAGPPAAQQGGADAGGQGLAHVEKPARPSRSARTGSTRGLDYLMQACRPTR